MIARQNFKGYWKLPKSEKFTHCGELSFDPLIGNALEMFGTLGNQSEITGKEEHQMIHGFSSDGKCLTLLNCIGHGNFSSPGITITKFDIEIVLIGDHHLSADDDLTFNIADFHFKFLDEWINIHGFEWDKDISKSTIVYNQPKPIEVYNFNSEKISIWFSYKGPTLAYFIKENTIKQQTLFELEYESPKKIHEIFIRIEILRNLVSFGLSRPTHLTRISCSKTFDKMSAHFDVLKKIDHFSESVEFISTTNMLFSFIDVKEYYRRIFKSWIDLYEKLLPVFDLYFQTIYNKYLGPVNTFLNFAFALETYHRRTSTDVEFSAREYDKLGCLLQNALQNESDKRFMEWVQGKLKYGNEKSFRKRIKAILKMALPILSDKIPHTRQFIQNVIDTRNYHVHFDSSLRPLDNAQFFQYNIRLKVLLQICLLHELQFETDSIRKFLQRTPTFWNID